MEQLNHFKFKQPRYEYGYWYELMFDDYNNFIALDLSSLNTSRVISKNYMFKDCEFDLATPIAVFVKDEVV